MKTLSIILACNLVCSAELITYQWPNEPHRQGGYDVSGTIVVDVDVSDPNQFSEQILPTQITSFDLDEHNKTPLRQYEDLHSSKPDPWPYGLACPVCDTELVDSNPMTLLTSDPPQKSVVCPSCGYSGYRVA